VRPALVASLWLVVAIAPAEAVEQAEAFIAGLNGRGLTDVVLDYLDHIESSRLIDDDFRQQIPYHRGVTLIDQARQTGARDERARLLAEAREQLDNYSRANPDRPEGIEARGALASALVEHAKRGQARGQRLPADERERLQEDARQLFDQARTMFESTETFYSDELAKLPKTLDPKKEQDLIDRRLLYRGRLAQARLLVAQSDYDKASTYPADSRQFRQLNESAAKALGAVFEQYSQWLVGFYANLYEGRCYQALGEYKKALGCYDNILAQPDGDPAFRRLIATGHRFQAECLIAQEQYDAAISNCETWLKKAHGMETQEPEWLAVRFRLADAYRAKAQSLDEENAQFRELIGEAREAYRIVSREPGEFQQEARAALTGLGGGRDTDEVPQTFVAAYDAGRAALDRLNQANAELREADGSDAAAVAELNDQVATAQADALRLFTLALSLADADVEVARLNEVRYFCCWLNYQAEDFYEAAILGEFVARRYSDHPAAAAAAKLAMAAYERLYALAVADGQTKQQTEFEAGRLAAMAEFITRRWPGSDDAEAAVGVLVNFALRNDRLNEARALVEDAPPDARQALELKLGNALWAKYVELSGQQATSDEENAASPDAIRSEAIELLSRGIEAARQSGDVTTSTAYAALYLVKALVSDGKYEQAVELLEDDAVGPLQLVSSNNAVASAAEYAASAYRSALQAYVSVQPPQGDKALDVMTKLEQSVAGDAQSAERLTSIYVALGVELQQQIEQLQNAGRDREAERVVAAFTEFLDRIANRQDGANWSARTWIAQTHFSMGEAMGPHSANGREYFARAEQAYQQMIDQADEDPAFAPSPLAVLAVKKQLGRAQRNVGEYQQALNTFSSILAEKVTRLDVQKEAAYTCQAWGEAGDVKWLLRAISGGLRQKSDGKNRIWGWAKIAAVVSRYKETNPTHRDTFFEAWLNTARCRYLAGTKTDGPEQKKYLAQAEATIRTMTQQYPDLGGDARRAEFETLARQIQQAQGRTPKGLDAYAAR
jgi:tetratricopeptide (TPR) repeat protein